MKSKILFVISFLFYGISIAQTYPIGSEQNPYNNLYVNDYLKVGQNSLWLNSTQVGGVENRLFSTNGALTINGVHPANGSVPAAVGNNTLINPKLGSVGIGLGASAPEAKLDINLGRDYLYKPSGLQVTIPIPAISGGPILNTSIFNIQKQYTGIPGGPTLTTTYMVLKDNTGNVGIGLANPESKLHVHNGQIKITGTNSYGGPMLLFGGSSSNAPAGQWGIEYVPQGATGLNFWKPSGSNNFGNYFLFLSDNGKVSIGLDPSNPTTFNGDYKLYVSNGILTEKVKVAIKTTADWADDVFDTNYKVMPLNEVKNFIAQEHHLPGVPSAEQVVSTGVNLAEMDAILLRKIEELTLHLIELEAQNENLQKQLKSIQGE